jgi:hypothetical protein
VKVTWSPDRSLSLSPIKRGTISIMVRSLLAPKDISKLLSGVPKGAWVALSAAEDQLLAYAEDLGEAVKKAHDLGEPDPVVIRVPKDASSLVL